MIASDIMSKKVLTVRESASIGEALEVLANSDIRHLPVLNENGEVSGMLSDRDVRAIGAHIISDLQGLERMKEQLSAPVTSLMSSDVITVEPESDVREIVDVMLDEKVGAVPVIDGETNELVGIVSYVDVLRSTRDLID